MSAPSHPLLRDLLHGAAAAALKHIAVASVPTVTAPPNKAKAQLIEDIISAADSRTHHAQVCAAALDHFSAAYIRQVLIAAGGKPDRTRTGSHGLFISMDAPSEAVVVLESVEEEGVLVPANDVAAIQRRARRSWAKRAAKFFRRKQESELIIKAMKTLVSQGTLTLRSLRDRTECISGISLREGAAYAFFLKHALRLLRNLRATGKRKRRPRERFKLRNEGSGAGDPLREFFESKDMHREDNLSHMLR